MGLLLFDVMDFMDERFVVENVCVIIQIYAPMTNLYRLIVFCGLSLSTIHSYSTLIKSAYMFSSSLKWDIIYRCDDYIGLIILFTHY